MPSFDVSTFRFVTVITHSFIDDVRSILFNILFAKSINLSFVLCDELSRVRRCVNNVSLCSPQCAINQYIRIWICEWWQLLPVYICHSNSIQINHFFRPSSTLNYSVHVSMCGCEIITGNSYGWLICHSHHMNKTVTCRLTTKKWIEIFDVFMPSAPPSTRPVILLSAILYLQLNERKKRRKWNHVNKQETINNNKKSWNDNTNAMTEYTR